MNLLVEASPEWLNLGLQLGVSHRALKIIQMENHHVVEHCFREMLAKWLQMTNPRPTWQCLIAALRSPLVNQLCLASELESDGKLS